MPWTIPAEPPTNTLVRLSDNSLYRREGGTWVELNALGVPVGMPVTWGDLLRKAYSLNGVITEESLDTLLTERRARAGYSTYHASDPTPPAAWEATTNARRTLWRNVAAAMMAIQ